MVLRSGASGTVCMDCFGLFWQKPSSLPRDAGSPSITNLSKEESVTVSLTKSHWVPLGEPGEKSKVLRMHTQASGIGREEVEVSFLCLWGSLLEWKNHRFILSSLFIFLFPINMPFISRWLFLLKLFLGHTFWILFLVQSKCHQAGPPWSPVLTWSSLPPLHCSLSHHHGVFFVV